MSLALTDATTWIEGVDFTTRLNELSVDASLEALDDTRFGTNGSPRVGRSRIGGLEDVETELNGFWEAPVDEAAFTGLGTADQAVTHSVSGAQGDVAYLYRARKFTYQTFGEVGSNTPFTLTMMGRDAGGVGRGLVAATSQTVSATGVLGSAVNLGDVADGEFLVATLHAFTAGTSVDVELQSDADSGFASPTTQATFSFTSSNGQLQRVAGPIADTWFRLNVTAITGTWTVAGAIGIA